jgi:tRNA 2-thiouridine synthesizing protein A
MEKNHKDMVLDVQGLLCPLPVLRARKLLESLSSGSVLEVVATDPMSAIDMPHFCEQQGHTLLSQATKDNLYFYRIRRK